MHKRKTTFHCEPQTSLGIHLIIANSALNCGRLENIEYICYVTTCQLFYVTNQSLINAAVSVVWSHAFPGSVTIYVSILLLNK